MTRADGDWGRTITALSPTTSQWEKLAALPSYMYKARLAADTENGRIYLAGCYSQENMTSLFARYDISTNSWQELAALPKETYAKFDEGGSTISSSLGIALSLYKGNPVVIRNYDGVDIIVSTYRNGAWETIKIAQTIDNDFTLYDKALFATPAKDGESLLLLLSSAPYKRSTLWRLTPETGTIEKLNNIPELQEINMEQASITASNGVIAIMRGAGQSAATPVFCDGEKTWTGTQCPLPETGEFTWTHAACGIYNGLLYMLEGTWNTAASIGNGAYYNIDGGTWKSAPTGQTMARNCGASVVVGDYIYRAAITDFFGGVEDTFERLDLRAERPVPTPQNGGGSGGCAGGFAAAALLVAIPMVIKGRKK